MWQDKLKEIIYILEHSDVNEIEVRAWGKTYRVVKSTSAPSMGYIDASQATSSTPIPKPNQTGEAETAIQDDKTEMEGEIITSPMPGTFYRSSSPDADPFVKEGDQIVNGDTLCIIEAMKIMNEIESEHKGTIQKVLVKNGTPVEYDQPLFVLNPE